MDKKQFLQVMSVLKSNYTNWNIDFKDALNVNVWYESLKDIPYEIALIGVRKLISTEQFYPNVAKIRAACASVTDARPTDSAEGWGMVQRAIRRFGYMRADEAVASLPKDVGRAVQNMGGFMALCESENVEADRAHFYRSLEQVSARQREDSVLSLDLKKAIEQHQIDSGNVMQIEEVINRRPLLEIDNTEIKKGDTESIGDVLRRQIIRD